MHGTMKKDTVTLKFPNPKPERRKNSFNCIGKRLVVYDKPHMAE